MAYKDNFNTNCNRERFNLRGFERNRHFTVHNYRFCFFFKTSAGSQLSTKVMSIEKGLSPEVAINSLTEAIAMPREFRAHTNNSHFRKSTEKVMFLDFTVFHCFFCRGRTNTAYLRCTMFSGTNQR